ncbi:hypothetical protein GC194_06235 [bacterium]|nr:hypothetical protein [bacterium]
MKTIKLTMALATYLLVIAFAANAQDVGFTVNRGVTAVFPDSRSALSTLNQGFGFGINKYKPLKKNLFIKTGLNMSFVRSCLSVQNKEGEVFALPEKYTYIDLPITLEKQFFTYSRHSRKATYYNVSAGVNLAYLAHERGFESRTGAYHTTPLNLGFSTALQWVKPVSWNASFAIGPFLRMYSTGEEHAKMVAYTGLKLDWKFGNYFGNRK